MSRVTSDRWRLGAGRRVDLAAHDPASIDGAPGGKDATRAASEALLARLGELQEPLWAESQQSLLVVLQAMDAGGKDGTVTHVFRGANPAGVRVVAFKQPVGEEVRHDFLWRVHKQVPARGEIVIFNRSHYEDVVVARVHRLVTEEVWRARYGLIRSFEDNLIAARTRVVKLFLHISKDEQARRLRARVDDPTKQWKFRRADLTERARWDEYQLAYADAISETSTETAPWYVIPADHKWYRNWAVGNIVVETLEQMNPQYPPGDDVEGVVIT